MLKPTDIDCGYLCRNKAAQLFSMSSRKTRGQWLLSVPRSLVYWMSYPTMSNLYDYDLYSEQGISYINTHPIAS